MVVSSFDSQRDNELTISKGDLVEIVTVSDDGWWIVKMVDDPTKKGLVPSVCLKDVPEDGSRKISIQWEHTNPSGNFNGMNHNCFID